MIWLGLCPHVSQSTGPFELTKAAAKQWPRWVAVRRASCAAPGTGGCFIQVVSRGVMERKPHPHIPWTFTGVRRWKRALSHPLLS
jgi:hypothetical protein